MKLKIVLVGSIITLLIFLIYLTTIDQKVYYLSLGDSLASGTTPYKTLDYGFSDYVKDYLKDKNILENYVIEFTNNDYRTTDLLRDIQDNKKIKIKGKDQSIKNSLIKADLITISIGYNDLLSKLNINFLDVTELKSNVEGIMEDIDELLFEIKEYCKEDIIIIGYYTPINLNDNSEVKEYIKYANNQLEKLAHKYDLIFIDIDSKISNNKLYFPNPNSPFISKLGYEAISKEVIKAINEILL